MSLPAPAPDPETNWEREFLAALPTIDRITAFQARRHALPPPEADEYAAWARSRVIDGEYAILRKFGGRSSLKTYLSAVLANLYRDYQNAQLGRWRISSAAKRLGPVAVRLEDLLVRQNRPLREAIEILRSAGVMSSDGELARIAAQLPARPAQREVSMGAPSASGAMSVADEAPPPDVETDDVRAIDEVVRSLVDELPGEDAMILRMRFWSDLSVADIARTLRLDQKMLYRRIDALRARLRLELASHGISHEIVRDSFADERRW